MQPEYGVADPTPHLLEKLAMERDVTGYTVSSYDAAGRLVATRDVEQTSSAHDENDVIEFAIPLPHPGPGGWFALEAPSGPPVTALVPDGEPEISDFRVEVDTEGIRYSATSFHPDGRPVRATLLYSPDREHWIVAGDDTGLVAGDISRPGGGQYQAATQTLPGSDEGWFRLVVTDGVNTAHADVGPLTIADKPPIVAIADPLTGSSFALNAPVDLEVMAFDLEDRSLEGEAVAWTSSVDGSLGTGRSLVATGLSAGTHLITVSVTDSAGQVASDVVEIGVDAAIALALPGPTETEAIIAAFARGPDDEEAPQRRSVPPWVLAALAVMVAGGGFALGRRQKA